MDNQIDKHFNKRKKLYALRRSILDYGIGLLIICAGIYFLFSDKILKREYFTDPILKYIMGGMCLVYGTFRMWRGKQQQYFKDDE